VDAVEAVWSRVPWGVAAGMNVVHGGH